MNLYVRYESYFFNFQKKNGSLFREQTNNNNLRHSPELNSQKSIWRALNNCFFNNGTYLSVEEIKNIFLRI